MMESLAASERVRSKKREMPAFVDGYQGEPERLRRRVCMCGANGVELCGFVRKDLVPLLSRATGRGGNRREFSSLLS